MSRILKTALNDVVYNLIDEEHRNTGSTWEETRELVAQRFDNEGLPNSARVARAMTKHPNQGE